MFSKILRMFERIGYARAAARLAEMGHYEAAKKAMMQYDKTHT